MSFVNYNKRSVNLPPGFKDLLDVLSSSKPVDALSIHPILRRDEASRVVVKPADIALHIRACILAAGTRALRISSVDAHLTMQVAHVNGAPVALVSIRGAV